jgi:hypothetical protein
VNERNIAGYLSGDWKMDKKLQNMIAKKRISEKESKETLRKVLSLPPLHHFSPTSLPLLF